MGLSEAGHLYKPPPRSWHWLRSKCNSVCARFACAVGVGSDDEHPPSVMNPSTAIVAIARFAILCAFEPDFRDTIFSSSLSGFAVPQIATVNTTNPSLRLVAPQ